MSFVTRVNEEEIGEKKREDKKEGRKKKKITDCNNRGSRRNEGNTNELLIDYQYCWFKSIKLNYSLLVLIYTKIKRDQRGLLAVLSVRVGIRKKKKNGKSALLEASISIYAILAYHLSKNIYATQFPMITTNKNLDLEKSDAKLEYAFSMSSQTPEITTVWLFYTVYSDYLIVWLKG